MRTETPFHAGLDACFFEVVAFRGGEVEEVGVYGGGDGMVAFVISSTSAEAIAVEANWWIFREWVESASSNYLLLVRWCTVGLVISLPFQCCIEKPCGPPDILLFLATNQTRVFNCS
jgi:hypothetical protein